MSKGQVVVGSVHILQLTNAAVFFVKTQRIEQLGVFVVLWVVVDSSHRCDGKCAAWDVNSIRERDIRHGHAEERN